MNALTLNAKSHGFLYVCLFSNKHIKVGRSRKSVRSRITSHATAARSMNVSLDKNAHFACSGDSRFAEADLIRRCADKCTDQFGREWFAGLDFDAVCAWAKEESEVERPQIKRSRSVAAANFEKIIPDDRKWDRARHLAWGMSSVVREAYFESSDEIPQCLLPSDILNGSCEFTVLLALYIHSDSDRIDFGQLAFDCYDATQSMAPLHSLLGDLRAVAAMHNDLQRKYGAEAA